MNSENWGTDHFISNFETVGGKVIGYVEMTLSANTSYEFAIYDLANSEWLKSGSNQVYYMTNGNSYVWDFATNKSYNCGITTAGAGTYRFIWNITDKKMTVTYPNFVIYRTGDKEGDPRAQDTDVESYDGGTIDSMKRDSKAALDSGADGICLFRYGTDEWKRAVRVWLAERE